MNDIRENGVENAAKKHGNTEEEDTFLGEAGLLKYLAKREDLAEKKSKIYSRLLTEQALAQEMERLAVAHAQGKKTLLELAKKAGG